MPQITLVLVDDHNLILEAWTALLNNDERFLVLGTAKNAEEAIPLISHVKPSVVLCDIVMTPVDGFDITRKIQLVSPETKIIGVSMYNIPAYAKKMLVAGAAGYVTKGSSADELKLAILKVMNGEKYICDEIKTMLASSVLIEDGKNGINHLTQKELEVITGVRQGLTSREIAQKMNLNYKTIEVHRYNILKKLGLNNTAALVNFMNQYE